MMQQPSRHALQALCHSHDFRLLLSGEAAWLLGNQFYLIALPWLVLQLTGDIMTLGTVLVAAGITRVALMPVGGALADRLSARTLMLTANSVRLGLLVLLAWLVLAGRIELWMLCGFSLAYGVVEALFLPARNAVVPLLVQPEQVQVATAIMRALEQCCGLIGPLLAGLLIGELGKSALTVDNSRGALWVDQSLFGIGVALAVDALAALGAVVSVCLMAPHGLQMGPKETALAPDLGASIKQAVVYVWRLDALRTSLLLIIATNLLTAGPLGIGLPVLAETRLAQGAAALGVLTSALGAGALLGTAATGMGPRPGTKRLGMVSALGIGLVGASLVALLSTTCTAVGALATFTLGVSISYINTTLVTWIQRHTPPALMGRVMSLVALR